MFFDRGTTYSIIRRKAWDYSLALLLIDSIAQAGYLTWTLAFGGGAIWAVAVAGFTSAVIVQGGNQVIDFLINNDRFDTADRVMCYYAATEYTRFTRVTQNFATGGGSTETYHESRKTMGTGWYSNEYVGACV